ncbi:MAG TPA: copper-binding protein [Candidatus Dormibacteraeota bacterium]|nr:copper-binding protein [Candidatus Dormibacteraeota bacterium]
MNMPRTPNSYRPRLALLFLCALLAFSAACNRGPSQPAAASSSATKRYPFKGKVISLDKPAATANIDNEPIPGFMDSMAMSYPIKPPAALTQLQPGDTIAAEVVVQPDNTYWLENVKVTGPSLAPAGKPSAEKDRRSK